MGFLESSQKPDEVIKALGDLWDKEPPKFQQGLSQLGLGSGSPTDGVSLLDLGFGWEVFVDFGWVRQTSRGWGHLEGSD